MKDGMPGEQEDRRIEHIIPAEAVKQGKYTCFIEVSCNLMFGLGASRYLHPQTDRAFPLVGADIVLPNPHARGLRTDFRILTEISRHPAAQATGLAQKALTVCNDIMNTFIRLDEETPEQLDALLQKCRKIGWKVLGELSEEQVKEMTVWKAKTETERPAEIWAIGHW
jgi:alpha-mannosidase